MWRHADAVLLENLHRPIGTGQQTSVRWSPPADALRAGSDHQRRDRRRGLQIKRAQPLLEVWARSRQPLPAPTKLPDAHRIPAASVMRSLNTGYPAGLIAPPSTACSSLAPRVIVPTKPATGASFFPCSVRRSLVCGRVAGHWPVSPPPWTKMSKIPGTLVLRRRDYWRPAPAPTVAGFPRHGHMHQIKWRSAMVVQTAH